MFMNFSALRKSFWRPHHDSTRARLLYFSPAVRLHVLLGFYNGRMNVADEREEFEDRADVKSAAQIAVAQDVDILAIDAVPQVSKKRRAGARHCDGEEILEEEWLWFGAGHDTVIVRAMTRKNKKRRMAFFVL